MFRNETTELDALILVGDDPERVERTLAALVTLSLDVALRTWVIEARPDVDEAAALHRRCVWTRSVDQDGNGSVRVNRAIAQGRAPLVLLVDGSLAADVESLRALVRHLREHEQLDAAGLGALPTNAHPVRPGAVGPALLVRRAALERHGRLDERGFSGLEAEAEAWIRRAQRGGADVQLTRRAPVAAAPREQGQVLRNTSRPAISRLGFPSPLERRIFRSEFWSGVHAPAGDPRAQRSAPPAQPLGARR